MKIIIYSPLRDRNGVTEEAWKTTEISVADKWKPYRLLNDLKSLSVLCTTETKTERPERKIHIPFYKTPSKGKLLGVFFELNIDTVIDVREMRAGDPSLRDIQYSLLRQKQADRYNLLVSRYGNEYAGEHTYINGTIY